MSVLKYVSQEGALRFLRTWALRITPPDQFNDPFEMRPPLTYNMDSVIPESFRMFRDEVEKQVRGFIPEPTEATDQAAKEVFVTLVVNYLFRLLSPSEEEMLFAQITILNGQADFQQLADMRAHIDEVTVNSMDAFKQQIPALLHIAERTFHGKLAEMMGVLCLSASNKHLLMWAHYADCHRGAVLEFDEKAPCFNRQRNSDDEFGWIRRVVYSDIRPQLNEETGDDGMATLSLTKALEWAYEQEVRLLWPLDMADRKIQGPEGESIHLIEVPASALKSVTIGCKAGEPFVEELCKLTFTASSKITIRVAQMDRDSYSLKYKDLN